MLRLSRLFWTVLLLVFVAADTAWGFVWPSRVQNMERQLRSMDVATRRKGIAEIRDSYSAILRPLVALALGDSDVEVRRAAGETVALHQLPLTRPIIDWLSSDEIESRFAAVHVFERVVDPGALAGLTRACRDEQVRIRRVAVRALQRYTGQSVIAALLRALEDDDADVRAAAVRGLSAQFDARVANALLLRGGDADELVRANVVLGIGVLGDAHARKLLQASLRDHSEKVRAAAATALGGLPCANDDRDAVLDALVRESSLSVVSAVLECLRSMPATRTAAGLLEVWHRLASGPVRAMVEEWIGSSKGLADQIPFMCLQSSRVVSKDECLRLLGTATTNARWMIDAARNGLVTRAQVLTALRRAPSPGSLDWVLGQLESKDDSVVELACEALDAILEWRRSGYALDPLISTLSRMVGAPLRPKLIRLIGKTGTPRALRHLDAILIDPTASQQELLAATEGLGFIDAPGRSERLVQLLFHADPVIALAAARELYRLSESVALGSLVVRIERGVAHRSAVLVALSGMLAHVQQPQSFARVGELLRHARGDERDALIEGFSRNRHPDSLRIVSGLVAAGSPADRAKVAEAMTASDAGRALLATLARSSDVRVRSNAVWSLGRVGKTDCEPILREAVEDSNLAVRANAVGALGRVAGRFNRSIRDAICPKLRDRHAGIREVALRALQSAGEGCLDVSERDLLIRDPSDRVRRAAARLIASRASIGMESADTQALRWCRGFETDASVRHWCFGPSGNGGDESDHSTGGLLYVKPTAIGAGGDTNAVGVSVGLERADGLVRFAVADRRGAVFEPDVAVAASRFIAPIELIR